MEGGEAGNCNFKQTGGWNRLIRWHLSRDLKEVKGLVSEPSKYLSIPSIEQISSRAQGCLTPPWTIRRPMWLEWSDQQTLSEVEISFMSDVRSKIRCRQLGFREFSGWWASTPSGGQHLRKKAVFCHDTEGKVDILQALPNLNTLFLPLVTCEIKPLKNISSVIYA